ncbi:MAG: hypothetical protein PHS92_03165 [Candidatus Gracilibacteria bacterium]|nr:hypothetical protein [Candidatus Gracilibacteria bacterium]
MIQYKEKFISLLNIKESPNGFELDLFKRTKKYLRYVSWIPGLKMVGVCNSLSMYATNAASDIDLFIITAKNRVWIVRFLMTAIFYSLGVWRKDESNSAGNFCLSFFIDENNLDLSKIAIENDVYLFYWIYYMKPVLNTDGMYEKFIGENKSLGIDEKDLTNDNMNHIYIYDYHRDVARNVSMITMITGYFWDSIDFLGYFLYMRIFRFISHKTKKVRRPFGVIISREILKFHDTDKREELRDKILGNLI